jgi:Tol biopolymer transport system component
MLPGTEGANSPFWSPDSRFIAFGVGNQLKKIDSAGGPPQSLCQAPLPITIVGSGAWGPNGVLLFGNRGGGPLLRVAAAGGVPSPVTALDPSRQETYHTQPSFLPDGRHFLYFRQTGAPEHVGVYVGSLDAKPAEQPLKRVLDVRFGASFVPTPNSTLANVLFLRDGTLMAQPFDSEKLEPSGDPVPVVEQVGGTNTYGNFSASPTGVLAYRTGNPGANQLTWHDRQGQQSGTAGEPGQFLNIALSPDAARVALQRPDRDLWLLDIARGVSTRFTFNPAIDGAPVWSPDGSQIVFRSNRNNGKFDLYIKPSNGASEETPLLETDRNKTATSWSRDGRFLLFESEEAKTQSDIWVLPMQGERKPVPVLQTPFDEWFAEFSPDGKWIAYLSDASGRTEVYVRPFTPPGSTASVGGQWQVSKDGVINNFSPHWRADQKELYFRGSGGALMAVDVNTSSSFQSGVPHPLFNLTTAIQGDMTADGKRVLLAIPQGSVSPSPITVVLNWQAALRK